MEVVTREAVERAPSIVRYDVRTDGVAVLTLEDPRAKHNTITPQLGAELAAALVKAEADRHVKAVVIASAKKDSFLVGANLEWVRTLRFASDAEDASREIGTRFAHMAGAIKPVVACVHGPALGGGFELALACTAAVVTSDPRTVLGLPEVKLGLMPAANGLLRVAERAGLRVALDLGLSGRHLEPREAMALGLVDEIVPPAFALDAACRFALCLVTRPDVRERLPARRAQSSRHRAWRMARIRAVERIVLEKNFIGRALLFRRARALASLETRGHYPAPHRMIDVLQRYGKKGFRAAADLEARLFGELVVSETSHRLVEVFFATTAAKKDPDTDPSIFARDGSGAYAKRILAPYVDEALRILGEGVVADEIDRALVDWGFPAGPLRDSRFEDSLPTSRGARARERRMPEEISLRCTMALVNEALRCLDEGVVRSARDGDLGAIFGLGFPPFRGGPFRMVDVLGAPEVLRRARSLEQRFGARFEPAPLLVEMARTGKRFYE
jgi:enoyl-CoA hydratase/carnithine racemase